MELIKDGKLIDENEWIKIVSSVETKYEELETNKERIKRQLKDQLTEVIRKCICQKNGVLFSGGIDSSLISLILKQINADFICYTVGLENAQDLKWAEKVSALLGFKLKRHILTLEEFENILKKVNKIIPNPDVMKLGVGCVTYAGSMLAKQDNCSCVFTGLGSEELFCGYERHKEALSDDNWGNVHNESIKGLKSMWKRDFVRDFPITKALNLKASLPFLNIEIIRTAMRIHPMYKISTDTKKIILREIAEEFGLPKEIAWRPKKAAQYGSYFDKGIEKLAKENGFTSKKSYIESLS